MKNIVFDSGPIINLALNDLLPIIEQLRKQYNGNFLIPYGVKDEIINRPLAGTKFKFEALRTLYHIKKGTIKIIDDKEIENLSKEFAITVNQCFRKNGKSIDILHKGEAEAIMLAKKLNADAVVIDETTARLIIENPEYYKHKLEHKLRAKITVDQKKLEKIKKMTEGLHIIRSTEIMLVAYKLGLMDKYLPDRIPNARETLLSSILWALKLNGCAITEKEIKRIVKREA